MVKQKIRLVARGFIQQHVIDCVTHIESVRLLLALDAQDGWPIHHMDIRFVYSIGIYMRCPCGSAAPGSSLLEKKVLRLHKALYRLPQALKFFCLIIQ